MGRGPRIPRSQYRAARTVRLSPNQSGHLEPIRLCYLNEKLRLDVAEARRNSPLLNLPARAAKLIIAYGSDELPELKRQSNEFAAAWSGRGLPGEIIEVAGCHHYAVLEQLARPDGLLAKMLASVAAD